MRHAHIGAGVQPYPQAARGLRQPRRQVDLAAAHRPIQLVLLGETHPHRLDAHALQDPLHQLHVGPGQALLAPVVDRPGCLHQQAHPQLPMFPQPGLLRGVERRVQRHQGFLRPGQSRPRQEHNEDNRHEHDDDAAAAMSAELTSMLAQSHEWHGWLP